MEYPFKDLMPLDEATARDGYYRDWTHIDADTFHQISELAKFIREKGRGSDTREAIAQALERVYHDAAISGNANMEVSQARGSYTTLAERLMNLDKVDRDNLNELMVLLAGRIKKGQVTMADLTQEVREVLNGDRPLPIVGKDSVIGYENIVKGTVTPLETSFLKLDENVNLFDGFRRVGTLYGVAPFSFSYDGTRMVAILEIEPNAKYSISLETGYTDLVKVATHSELLLPEDGRTVLDGNHKQYDNYSVPFIFETADTDKYIYIVTAGEPKMRVVKSDTPQPMVDNPYIVNPHGLNLYSKDEVDELMTRLITPINLFDGRWIEGKTIAGTTGSFTINNMENRRIAVLPVIEGQELSINLGGSTLSSNGYYYFKILTSTSAVDEVLNTSNFANFSQAKQFDDDTRHYNLTVGAGENSLIIMAGAETSPYMEVVEGVTNTLYATDYENSKYKLNSNIVVDRQSTVGDKKTAVFMGDSIFGNHILPDKISEINHYDFKDCSIPGSTLSTHHVEETAGFSVMNLLRQAVSKDYTDAQRAIDYGVENGQSGVKRQENLNTFKTVDWVNTDILIIDGGTNDFGGGQVPLESFRSAFETIINYANQLNPKMQIYFITAGYRTDWEAAPYRPTIKLISYVDIMKEEAAKFGYPVFDLFRHGGVNQFNASQYLKSDGLHQNDLGNDLWAHKIASFIMSN